MGFFFYSEKNSLNPFFPSSGELKAEFANNPGKLICMFSFDTQHLNLTLTYLNGILLQWRSIKIIYGE